VSKRRTGKMPSLEDAIVYSTCSRKSEPRYGNTFYEISLSRMSIVCRGIPVNGTDVGMIPFAKASRQFILSVTTYREQDK
jgi:hypothetical protein